MNAPLIEQDFIEENGDYFMASHRIKEKVQEAKRLLKKLLTEQMESQEELFIALEYVDACFQVPDGDDKDC